MRGRRRCCRTDPALPGTPQHCERLAGAGRAVVDEGAQRLMVTTAQQTVNRRVADCADCRSTARGTNVQHLQPIDGWLQSSIR